MDAPAATPSLNFPELVSVTTLGRQLNDDFAVKSKFADTSRWYVNRFIEVIAPQLRPGLRILDAGAGECAYKQHFGHCDYVAVDLAVGDVTWNYHNLDCISSLHALCFRDESFDAVLCTQVLEHLEWPRESVAEFFRVLKPGGKLFITVPMAQEEHQIPYDFFRYTSFGLRSMCERAGLKVSHIQPLGGIFARWAYELPRLLSIFPPIGLTKGTFRVRDLFLIPVKALLLAAIRILQALLFAIDGLDRVRNDPLGWSVIAQK